MTVIPFRKRQPQSICLACYLKVEPDAPLEKGRSVAWSFPNSQVVFVDWAPPDPKGTTFASRAFRRC